MKYENFNYNNGSFWNGDKHSEEVDILNLDIPTMDKVKDKARPMLEEWRRLQNAYYRYYNDGDGYLAKLRHMGKRFGVELAYSKEYDDRYGGNYAGQLEELADAVYEAAINEYNEIHLSC